MHLVLRKQKIEKFIAPFLFHFSNLEGRVLLSDYEFENEGRTDAPYFLSTKQIEDLFWAWCDVKFLENPDSKIFQTEV